MCVTYSFQIPLIWNSVEPQFNNRKKTKQSRVFQSLKYSGMCPAFNFLVTGYFIKCSQGLAFTVVYVFVCVYVWVCVSFRNKRWGENLVHMFLSQKTYRLTEETEYIKSSWRIQEQTKSQNSWLLINLVPNIHIRKVLVIWKAKL